MTTTLKASAQITEAARTMALASLLVLATGSGAASNVGEDAMARTAGNDPNRASNVFPRTILSSGAYIDATTDIKGNRTTADSANP
jgi:hypothetical protein